MDGDLVNQCQNLRINEAESKIINIGVVGGEEDVEHVSLLLLGKLVTVRRFNVEAFKRTMTLVLVDHSLTHVEHTHISIECLQLLGRPTFLQ